ncbi:TetR/AcrR family transcriptional regulator [Microbacterium karelineae]|uniref:TetR/AcrR family transcriptional regulator n=1 Tax=Microbacterium karelineae TaxID=2654283 RepID=UPI0018D3D648|nr:TetR/AcrR family transcriptional regulator [Microbacterium karelineae]
MSSEENVVRLAPGQGSRTRLLAAVADLTYREGVGVGVQTLAKAARVSKRSMYELFGSKEALLTASLEERAPDYLTRLLPPDDLDSPRARILHVFAQLEKDAASPGYRGCPFLAVQVELKDPQHPASRVADRIKDQLAAFFLDEARRGGALEPGALSRQLMFIYDGAAARGGVKVDDLRGILPRTVDALLDAAGVHEVPLRTDSVDTPGDPG